MNPALQYREAAVAGAHPVRLVILLYEQAVADLRRAMAAQAKSDIEERTREINHAIQVIGHLQATLDKDEGGNVAVILDRFYEQVRCGLVEAQCKQSASLIERQIAHLLQVHEAWCAVERAMSSSGAASHPANEPQNPADWKV
jgi:flagellar secretion chaperone FliS